MKGYRTLVFNLVPMLAVIFDYLILQGDLVKLMITDPTIAALTMCGINCINIALRFMTTTPVGQKETM